MQRPGFQRSAAEITTCSALRGRSLSRICSWLSTFEPAKLNHHAALRQTLCWVFLMSSAVSILPMSHAAKVDQVRLKLFAAPLGCSQSGWQGEEHCSSSFSLNPNRGEPLSNLKKKFSRIPYLLPISKWWMIYKLSIELCERRRFMTFATPVTIRKKLFSLLYVNFLIKTYAYFLVILGPRQISIEFMWKFNGNFSSSLRHLWTGGLVCYDFIYCVENWKLNFPPS